MRFKKSKNLLLSLLELRDLIWRQARRGKARRGEARRREARQGEARRGQARPGEAGAGGAGISGDLEGFAPVVRGSLPEGQARTVVESSQPALPPLVSFGALLDGFGMTLEVVFRLLLIKVIECLSKNIKNYRSALIFSSF